ncbi:hypothetical protein PEL8287_00328 [Roseovarius litorisediminis]|uniref:DUF1284 domain-containing protein n=1 Tax=Roseovarius litorisediminis TaxID=1312363 RepID=A0A1Y5RD89_9RHOB|nr:DUF1284 domain-containing protein [Roseovarius litorisediminis]SLN12240.1 hypothetical protein PEL8287_00328 [Roseovarius litorisediminis]
MALPTVTFRPHHFLCSLGFQGKGYSDGFTANMARIVVEGLRAPGGDDTLIEVTGATDDICAPCPKRRGQICDAQEKIAALDSRHARALGLFSGTCLTWAEAKRRIVKRVPPGALQNLCSGCQWLDLGLCEQALFDLHTETKNAAP